MFARFQARYQIELFSKRSYKNASTKLIDKNVIDFACQFHISFLRTGKGTQDLTNVKFHKFVKIAI